MLSIVMDNMLKKLFFHQICQISSNFNNLAFKTMGSKNEKLKDTPNNVFR